MLKEHLVFTEQSYYHHWWRASLAGGCPTFLFNQVTKVSALPVPARIHHLWDDGRMHEQDLVERLVSAGYQVRHSCLDRQIEVIASEKPSVGGHPDGIVYVPNSLSPLSLARVDSNFDANKKAYLLELTSCNLGMFMKLIKLGAKQVLAQKYAQIQLYLHSKTVAGILEGERFAVLIAKCKNNSDIYEEGITYDKAFIDSLLETLKQLDVNVSAGERPSFRCNDYRRYTCQFRETCYGSQQVKIGVGTLDGTTLKEAEQLKEMAISWAAAKGELDDADFRVEEAREFFRELMIAYGAEKLSIGNVVASRVPMNRTSIDTLTLQQKFPDAYRAVATPKSSEQLRVYKKE